MRSQRHNIVMILLPLLWISVLSLLPTATLAFSTLDNDSVTNNANNSINNDTLNQTSQHDENGNVSSLSSSSSSSSSSCAATKTYTCPHEYCGTIQVEDCLDQCPHYRNTDPTKDICFARHLFSSPSMDINDPDHYYHFLWNDIVAAVVWVLTAGVAMACGVGGGGIYVPLGILLLQFAPKPASGLSQASIFGASLGGILLNIRHRHPQDHIRSDPGEALYKKNNAKDKNKTKERTEEESFDMEINEKHASSGTNNQQQHQLIRHQQKFLSLPQEQSYLQNGGTYYTRPLIHYDMALFLAPMEMAGAVLGVLIQKMLPNWLYLLVAGVVLAATAYKTFLKYFGTRQSEQQAATNRTTGPPSGGNDNDPNNSSDHTASKSTEPNTSEDSSQEPPTILKMATLLTGTSPAVEGCEATEAGPDAIISNKQPNNDNPSHGIKSITPESSATETITATASAATASPVPAEEDEMLEEGKPGPQIINHDSNLEQRIAFLEHDMRQYPYEKISALLILWIGLFFLTLMKGGKGVDSIVGIDCTSPVYSVLVVAQFIWMFGYALWFGRRLYQQQVARVAVQYPFLEQDPLWDAKSLKFYGGFTFVAGVVAGLIGIGGGMVLGPLMLVMGIHPRVSSATTATMIVLTSSSVAVMFVTSGTVPWDYAVFYFSVCFCGAIVGKSVIDGYVKRTGKASMLIFILATIIALATVGCFVILLINLANNGWCFDGFHPFCSVEEDGEEGECPVDRFLEQMPRFR